MVDSPWSARWERAARWVTAPPRWLSRVQTAWRTGMLERAVRNPVNLGRLVVSGLVGVRGVHRLHAGVAPESVALVDRHRSLGYREADQEIDALASVFIADLGASRRAPVALMLENRVEYVLAWFALFRLGIPAAHISYHSTAAELEQLLHASAARVVVFSASTASAVLAVATACPDMALRRLYVGDETAATRRDAHSLRFVPAVERARRRAAPRPVDAMASDNVVYTSGTTGRPKGAVRNFASLGPAALLSLLNRLPLRVGDRHLVVAPLYHSGAQAFTLLNTALGAEIHVAETFDAADVLRRIHELEIANVFMVPTMIARVLELSEALHRRYPAPHLRALIAGAAPFSEPLRRETITRFGAAHVFDFYGATELGWVTLVDGHEMLARPGTLGRAVEGQEIAIFDSAGEALTAGTIGRIYTRSVQAMAGYMRDPTATAAVRLGPWMTVDDLGYLDRDGYLFLTGRARDMVVSGGVNIYPAEVERVLLEHPAIDDVAVVGVPDSQWGERLVAVVVAGEGFDPDAASSWARGRMTAYKVPRTWMSVPELPRNPTGKLLKRRLVEALRST